MSDAPYGLDFLQQVVDVHWSGGDYVVLVMQASVVDTAMGNWTDDVFVGGFAGQPGAAFDIIADFNDPGDGSDGTLTTNKGSVRTIIPFAPSTHIILPSDMNGTIIGKQSGKRYKNSFGTRFQNHNFSVGATYFLCTSNFSGATLKLELDTGPEQLFGYDIFTYKKGIVKAGVNFGDINALNATDHKFVAGGTNLPLSLNLKSLIMTPE